MVTFETFIYFLDNQYLETGKTAKDFCNEGSYFPFNFECLLLRLESNRGG
jgi:hypothetical protein